MVVVEGLSLMVFLKQRLLQAGAHILGVILNKVELVHTHGYGYYYYYGSDGTSGGDIRR